MTGVMAARGPGRPHLVKERVHFQSRIRASLKEQLQRSANDEGRSLSEEIEYRLERSFWEQDNGLIRVRTEP